METRSDQSNSNRSVQIVWSLEDRISGNPRSYACSFCKKGFSNAQALGGHMNIHRKDRARLRVQSSDEAVLSLEIGTQIDQSQVFEDKDVTLLESITKGKSSSSSTTPKRPCSLSSCKEDHDTSILTSKAAMEEDDHQHLPLFLNATSSDEDGKTSDDGRDREGNDQMGLDLELRLGLEPHRETTTTTATKSTIEFF